MNVDGAPTIFGFHASCATAVAEAHRRLRREPGTSPWELRLPDGRTLRSEVVRARAEGREPGEELVLMALRRLDGESGVVRLVRS